MKLFSAPDKTPECHSANFLPDTPAQDLALQSHPQPQEERARTKQTAECQHLAIFMNSLKYSTELRNLIWLDLDNKLHGK